MQSQTLSNSIQKRTASLVTGQVIKVSGNPLDFSFLKLQNIESLKKEEPRSGKRKPIEESEDEEDQKKNENLLNPQLDAEKQDQDKQMNQQKETSIKANMAQQINSLLANNNISLQANKNQMLGRKNEDTKVEAKRKKLVNVQCTSIFLNNNEIRTVMGLRSILDSVMWEPSRLEWLDLSYNFLEKIEIEILEFPNLKTVYLHGNYISNLEEAKKLQDLPYLQTLTLYGNFIEQIKGYRLYILGMMYEKYETLKKLDSVLITRKEFDNVIVWNERLYATKRQKLRKLKPENVKAPPEKKEDESKTGQNAQQQ
ncbi:leucine-rich repeat-containing protein 51-like [Stylonychia lemnae]|uniref:Leucine-rich repeat-containing protein 51 n=1 Tax=Stylonychia lemnae TaxID=5949 RepID=A0A078AMA8_STYLE|nr:leucine-rich repeat-containing protein 51-like [Stylonychia lemnae]|eukprot:CDW82522.1 leucine-rich repeat-containing protein 51-like [Stylonychia lemnae]